VGEAAVAEAADSHEGAPVILRPSAGFAYPGRCAETSWQIPRKAQRQPLRTGEALPDHKEGSLNRVQQ
jgi:hypothetical protein